MTTTNMMTWNLESFEFTATAKVATLVTDLLDKLPEGNAFINTETGEVITHEMLRTTAMALASILQGDEVPQQVEKDFGE